jgi:hypothetical protein
MWHAGVVHVTPAEVFAERVQNREPAFLPTHDGTCRVLLIANQQAPPQCAPPVDPLPAECRRPDAMCYAVMDGDSSRYVPAPSNGFFYRVAEPSWPVGGPLAAGIRRVLREADPSARVWRVDSPRRWRERFLTADIAVVLVSTEAAVIHVARMTEAARRELAVDPTLRVVPLIAADDTHDVAAVHSNFAVIVSRRAGR